jgi:hypothetical protein
MSIQVKDATGATQTVNTLPTVGQAASAASLPVVLASDQSAVQVSSGQAMYTAGDGRKIPPTSTLGILFSDDFGGTALDTTKWDVIDGGLPANPTLDGQTLEQGAIGSGVLMGNGVNGAGNSALSVSNSALSIVMGTINGAELWLLSKQVYACTEDVTVLIGKSQSSAANSIQVIMVEVDQATGVPLLNPNLAGYFTNFGGLEFGASSSMTQAAILAVGDSSPVIAQPAPQTTFAPASMSTPFEATMEFHAEDIIASAAVVDSASGKLPTVLRVSSQVPNDGKAYKLLLRFRNTAAPGSSTTVTIPRILVVDGQEMRVEIASGRGDSNPQKGIAFNIAGSPVSYTLAGYLPSSLGYTDSTTALGANGSVTGTARSGAVIGAVSFNKYNAVSYADQGGTLSIQHSVDNGSTWQTIDSATIAAGGGAAILSVPLTGAVSGGSGNAQWRTTFANGSTAQTVFRLSSSFSQA